MDISAFITLGIGWALGILGPIISDRVKRPFRRKELEKSIRIELEELRIKMAMVCYLMRTKFGGVNRAFLFWFKGILEGYTGPIEPPPPTDVLKKLSELDDDQLKALTAHRQTTEKTLSFKKASMPFALAHISELSLFSLEYQRRVLDIRAQLDLYNEDVEFALSAVEKTFIPSIMDVNKDAVLSNVNLCYRNLATSSEDIANKISKLLENRQL